MINSGKKRARNDNCRKLPVGVCVKVDNLRPQFSDLEAWLKDKRHALVCRGGRVFIGSGATKHVFYYPTSEFANPFKVKEYGLDKSLQLFEEHLDKLLEEPGFKSRFLGLADFEELG